MCYAFVREVAYDASLAVSKSAVYAMMMWAETSIKNGLEYSFKSLMFRR